jgi:polygalacturonase
MYSKSVPALISTNVGSTITNYKAWGRFFVNVKDSPFRAEGDGTTDDTEAIQAAIDYADSQGIGVVRFPPGTYKTTGDLTVTVGVSLIGDDVTIYISGLKSVYFKGNQTCTGIVFDGQNACNTGVSIEGDNVDFYNNTIQNIKAISATTGRGLYIQANASNITVHDNWFLNHQANGTSPIRSIVVEKVSKCRIYNNKFSGMTGLDDGDYLFVSCQQVANSTIAQFGGYYFDFTEVAIENNTFWDTTKSAIKLEGSGVVVKGNVIYPKSTGSTYGIRAINAYGGTITGNVIKAKTVQLSQAISIVNCAEVHVDQNPEIELYYTSGTIYGVFINSCYDCSCVGNRMKLYTSVAGASARNHILSSDKIKIDGNHLGLSHVTLDGSSNVNISKNTFEGTPPFGVDISDTGAASSNVTIEGNVAFLVDRFVALRTNNKTGIKVINNALNFSTTPTDSASLVAFFFGGQDKTQVTVFGNSPSLIDWDYGITANRPATNKPTGYRYYDTTLGAVITWEGAAWSIPVRYLDGSTTWDPPSIAAGAQTFKNVTILGVDMGDYAVASFSNDILSMIMTAKVVAANTVEVDLYNSTGASVNLASGTLKVRVFKAT